MENLTEEQAKGIDRVYPGLYQAEFAQKLRQAIAVINDEVDTGAAAALGARLDALEAASVPDLAAGATVAETTDATVSKSITIPVGDLQVGTRITVYGEAVVESVDGSPSLESELRFDDATGDVITTSTARSASANQVRANHGVIIVRELGATGVVTRYGWSFTNAVNTQSPVGRSTLDLTAGLTIVGCLKWSASHADNKAAYDGLSYKLEQPAAA